MKRSAVCLLLAACQPALDEQAQPIVGGMLDGSDGAVVAIIARRTRCEDSAAPLLCSGTLIAPRVVLTAAHCIAPGAGQGTLEVFVGAPVGDPAGQYILVDDAVRHPMFDDATHAYDLGLLRLAEAASVAPVALPTDAPTGGATARVVGYGVTQAGMLADGNRREATMTVGTVGATTFDATPLTGNSCGGDSGGPVFVAVGSGEELLGVTSSGDALCQTNAIDARVDVALADFIQPFIAAAPPVDGAIALDAVCRSPCTTAADCPAAMACLNGQCQVAGGMAGDLTTACTTDMQCGIGGCARVTPSDCRCLEPCTAGPPPGGSCAASDPAWPAALLVIALRRRRSAHRTRA